MIFFYNFTKKTINFKKNENYLEKKLSSVQDLSKLTRWFVLLLVSISISANYYVYDAMSSIKSIMQSELGFSNTAYGWLVSLYSFPNTFLAMSILGGIILDRWGIRKTGLLFVSLCVLGTFFSSYGASPYFSNGGFGYSFVSSIFPSVSPELKMLMLGRLLFGLGAETSIVVSNKIMVKWFKGKELALAFGVNLAVARLGTAAALILSPVFVNYIHWTTALWTATILMTIGLVCFVIYIYLDRKHTPKEDKSAKLAEDEIFRLRDIVDLVKNKSFIYVCILCVTFYSAVFPFQSYCPDLLHNKFNLSIEWSGILSSLIIWGTIVFTPLFGYFVDKKGKRASLMFVGSALLILSHLILSLTYLTPYIPMFILGIAFSLVPAAMWPSVALIVEEKKLGTAYGTMASIQNLGLWAFPIIAGWVLDKTNVGVPPGNLDYTYTILVFAGLGIIGFLFAFLLKHNETKGKSHGLELPSKS